MYRIFGLIIIFLLGTKQTLAACPVCVIAVGAGVSLSRWLGVDDLISGLWIGAFMASLVVWTIDWLESKNIKYRFRNFSVFSLYYVLTLIPLYYKDFFSSDDYRIGFMSRLLLGIIVGTSIFFLSQLANFALKEKNDGKVYFPFQKIVLSIVILVLFNILFYFV